MSDASLLKLARAQEGQKSLLLLGEFEEHVHRQQLELFSQALAKFRQNPAQPIEFFISFFSGYDQLEQFLEIQRTRVRFLRQHEKEILPDAPDHHSGPRFPAS